jgi:hypothetical protein
MFAVDNRTMQVRGIAQLSIEDVKSENDLHKSGEKDGDSEGQAISKGPFKYCSRFTHMSSSGQLMMSNSG